MDRRLRIVVTAGVIGALATPVMLNRDSFPLSTYPMYSRARGGQVTLATARAVTANGSTTTLSLTVIGNSDDPLIVAGELRQAIRDDRAGERCVEIASRAAAWTGLNTGTVAIEVVTERHDVVAQVSGDDSLVEREIHARCELSAP